MIEETADTTFTEAPVKKQEPFAFVKRFWAGFHNAIIIALLFTLIGIGVGIKVSSQFYADKLDEVVQTGAMLHKKKVYTVQPKI